MDRRILLSHGAGGREMAALIDEVFLARYGVPTGLRDDSAVLKLGSHRLAFTTDSFVVDPLFFPGGDIGRLAVAGTVNDLLTAAARPLVLSASFILEEGLEIDDIAGPSPSPWRQTAAEARVAIVTGDTKVVPKGSADKVFITTAGVGLVLRPGVSGAAARPGDEIILTGSVGDHGTAVMLAREKLLDGEAIASDAAPLTGLVLNLLEARPPPSTPCGTPPGAASPAALNEIARQSQVCHGNHRDPGAGETRGGRGLRGPGPGRLPGGQRRQDAHHRGPGGRRQDALFIIRAAPTARRPGSSARSALPAGPGAPCAPASAPPASWTPPPATCCPGFVRICGGRAREQWLPAPSLTAPLPTLLVCDAAASPGPASQVIKT